MPSTRAFRRRAFQLGLYEAQDVLADVADVDLVCLEPRPGAGFWRRERWQRRLLYRDVTRRLVFMNPGLERVRVAGDYDVFVAVCQNYWDLLAYNAMQGWKDRCRTSVCWLDELWVADLPHSGYWLHALNQFDHVFLGCAGSVGPVSSALGRQCHWVGGAVDTIRFSPYPQLPDRVIDIYRIGRTNDRLHAALRQVAADHGWFYVHDTVRGSDLEPLDHREHRELLARMAKRSRFFVVAPGKVDMPGETQGQVELGYRYYEGSAAGAVMIGQLATCASFRERFGWPDAVVEVAPDGSDAVEVLSQLASDPDRLLTISHRNATEALLRHDWVYRWKRIFEVVGLQVPAAMDDRVRRLRELATCAADASVAV